MSPPTKSKRSNRQLFLTTAAAFCSSRIGFDSSICSELALDLPDRERFLSFFFLSFLCFLEDFDFFDFLLFDLELLLTDLSFFLSTYGSILPVTFKSTSRLFFSIAKMSSSPSESGVYSSV